MLRTKAEPQADGTYKVSGTKIFISVVNTTWPATSSISFWRLPDAPAGTKGNFLFIVPKFTVAADGNVGERTWPG
jgi:alkylation response protein AidB-like acyl-CoA dehydrogenase